MLMENDGRFARRQVTHFHDLDALRGLAALIVLFGHASSVMLTYTLVPNKTLAVQFFFALSGFVICHVYDDRIMRGLSFFTFMKARVVRLYPLIVLATLLCTVQLFATSPQFIGDPQAKQAVILSTFALPTKFAAFSHINSHFPVNPPEWSLFCEMLAYAAFWVAVPLMRDRRMRWLSLLPLAAYLYLAIRMPLNEILSIRVLGAVVGFGVGVTTRKLLGNRAQPARTGWSPWFLVAVAGFVALCFAPATTRGPGAILCTMVASPLLLWFGSQQEACGRIGRWLGALSYPLYVTHWPCLLVIHSLLQPSIGAGSALVVGCAASILLASIAYALYDVPVRAWLGGKRGGRLIPARATA